MYIKEHNTYNKFNAYLCFHKHKYHLLKIQSECNTYYKINCLMAYNTSIFQTNYTIIALFNSYIKAAKYCIVYKYSCYNANIFAREVFD